MKKSLISDVTIELIISFNHQAPSLDDEQTHLSHSSEKDLHLEILASCFFRILFHLEKKEVIVELVDAPELFF